MTDAQYRAELIATLAALTGATIEETAAWAENLPNGDIQAAVYDAQQDAA